MIASPLLFSLAACTSPTAGDDPPPDADSARADELIAADWSLAAGTEEYLCVTQTVTEDAWVSAFRPVSPPGTHHTGLSIGTPSGPDGVTVCDGTARRDRILFGSAVGTEEMVLPPGTAVRIEAGQQMLLNLHLFNASPSALDGHSAVGVTLTDTAPELEAGFALAGRDRGVTLPLGTSAVELSCTVPVASSIFAVLPHMHLNGAHLEATVTTEAGTQPLLDVDYAFDDQRYHDVPMIAVAAGDQVHVICTYDNQTGAPIAFGESTTEEMCVLGIGTIVPWVGPTDCRLVSP